MPPVRDGASRGERKYGLEMDSHSAVGCKNKCFVGGRCIAGLTVVSRC